MNEIKEISNFIFKLHKQQRMFYKKKKIMHDIINEFDEITAITDSLNLNIKRKIFKPSY